MNVRELHIPSMPTPKPTTKLDRISVIGLPVVLSAYVISFFLPVDDGLSGAQAFYYSVLAAGTFRGFLGWLPNPLLGIGVISLAQKGWLSAASSGVLGVVAVLLSLLWTADLGLGRLQAGFFVWQASMVFLAVFGFWATFRRVDEGAEA